VTELRKDYALKVASSLKEVTQNARCGMKGTARAVSLLRDTASVLKPVMGMKNESTKSEKLEKTAMVFLTFPADPTGVTYAVGAALYGTGKAIKSVEQKNTGIRDIVRIYRKLGIELYELLKG
jgi:hypothetical protein